MEILSKIALSDKRVKIFAGKNIGYVKSFFTLIKMLSRSKVVYDYYSLSYQDDVWKENKLKVAIGFLDLIDDSIPKLYGSASYLVDEKLNFIGVTQQKKKPLILYNTIIQNFMPGHLQVMNRQLLLKLNDVDASQVYVHDSYITNVAVLTGIVVFDNNPYTYYRQHSSNELGATSKFSSWLKSHIKRIKRGDSKKYSKQISYVYYKYKDVMTREQRNEIESFLKSRKLLKTRLSYIFHTKLYRQNLIDNILFKILYVVGGYNT